MRDVGMMLLDERDAFRRGDDADHADVAGAGPLQQIERRDGAAAGGEHRIDHQHEAVVEAARQLRVVPATRPPSVSSRCRPMWPTRAAGSSSSTASSMPSPARSTGTTTTSAADPPAVGAARAASRHGRRFGRQVAQRLGGQQHADARRHPAERLGGVGVPAAEHQERILHERMIDEVDRHGPLYTIGRNADNAARLGVRRRTRGIRVRSASYDDHSPRCRVLAAASLLLVLAARLVAQPDRPAPGVAHRHRRHRRHDGRQPRECCRPAPSRSTARTSSRSTRPTAIAQAFAGGRDDRRDRAGRPARPDQHPHARADGDVPRPRRRPGADGLAAASTSFPAEAKTVSPEFVRVGTRLAALEMIQSGTTTFADMYYFEEEIARATQGGGPARRARADDHPVPGRRREDAGRGAGAGRGVHQGVRGRRSDRRRRSRRTRCTRSTSRRSRASAALADRYGVPDPHPPRRDRGRGRRSSREQHKHDAGRATSSRSASSGPRIAGGARRLGDRRRHRDPEARAASACRTTPRAT